MPRSVKGEPVTSWSGDPGIAGAEYVITKHGRPVARLVPYSPPAKTSFFGSMKGTVLAYERPFEPVEGEYDVNSE